MKPRTGRLLLVTTMTAGMVAACSSGGHAGHQPPRASSAAVVSSAPTAAGSGSATTRPTNGRSAAGAHSRSPGRRLTGGRPAGASAPYPTPAAGIGPSLHSNQASVLDSLPGSRRMTCAQVGTHTDLRSGSLAVGNFAVARKSYVKQVPITEVPTVFLYLIPQHMRAAKKAVVTMHGPGTTQRVTSKDVEEAGDWRYFALNLPVSSPGSYQLNIAAGVDRGCFRVTFRK